MKSDRVRRYRGADDGVLDTLSREKKAAV